jgi:hypothetical protein
MAEIGGKGERILRIEANYHGARSHAQESRGGISPARRRRSRRRSGGAGAEPGPWHRQGRGRGRHAPPGGTYWAFDRAALTGAGLAAGMSPNPYPAWKPGAPGLTPAQIDRWVNWYIERTASLRQLAAAFRLIQPGVPGQRTPLPRDAVVDLFSWMNCTKPPDLAHHMLKSRHQFIPITVRSFLTRVCLHSPASMSNSADRRVASHVFAFGEIEFHIAKHGMRCGSGAYE